METPPEMLSHMLSPTNMTVFSDQSHAHNWSFLHAHRGEALTALHQKLTEYRRGCHPPVSCCTSNFPGVVAHFSANHMKLFVSDISTIAGDGSAVKELPSTLPNCMNLQHDCSARQVCYCT